METIVYNNRLINIPKDIINNIDQLKNVFNLTVWDEEFTDLQKHHIMKFLPNFPRAHLKEREKTLKMLFDGSKFNYEGPIETFHDRLSRGFFDQKIGPAISLQREIRFLKFHKWYHTYHCNLLNEIVLMRQYMLSYAKRILPITNASSNNLLSVVPHLSALIPLMKEQDKESENDEIDIDLEANRRRSELNSEMEENIQRIKEAPATKQLKICKNIIEPPGMDINLLSGDNSTSQTQLSS